MTPAGLDCERGDRCEYDHDQDEDFSAGHILSMAGNPGSDHPPGVNS